MIRFILRVRTDASANSSVTQNFCHAEFSPHVGGGGDVLFDHFGRRSRRVENFLHALRLEGAKSTLDLRGGVRRTSVEILQSRKNARVPGKWVIR